MATRALTPDREKMTALLREIMDRSPDPHLPRSETESAAGFLPTGPFPLLSS